MIRVLMCVGLPNAGKSTFLKRITMLTDTFSPDARLYDNGKYVWTPERLSVAWQLEYCRFGKALTHFHGVAHQELFAWDATFTTIISRSAIVNIAKGADCQVDALFFDTPLWLCQSRNKKRSEDRRIPDNHMAKFAEQLQPPTKAEGFHNVIPVKPQNAHLVLAEIIEWVQLPLLRGARGR
jgi:predicted kinase